MTDEYPVAPSLGLTRKAIMLPFVMLDYLHAWWSTRRWRHLLEGLPAILVAALVVLPAVTVWLSNSNRLIDRYKVAVNQAINEVDPATADVYLRKLLRLDAMDPEIRYAMAFVANHQGDEQRANRLLTELANSDPGHPRAHLWMARQLAANKTSWNVEETERLLHHLQAALRSSKPPTEARVMLGQLYFQQGNHHEALVHFETALPERPELHLAVAQIYLKLDDQKLAKRELQRAARYFEQRVSSDAKDVQATISWAVACQLQQMYAEAQAILLRGLKSQPDEPQLRQLLAAFYVDESDRLLKSSSPHPAERLSLLENALSCAANYPPALSRLSAFFTLQGEIGERARLQLKEILASGKATATVHLILGTQAVAKGDLAEAELHFEQAHELNPNMPVLLNNFAWLLASQEEPQLDQALQLVNRAVMLEPTEPHIRTTRGQIYAKLGQHRKALPDLEFALQTIAGDPDLHETLATVYRELGDDELAAEHLRRAKLQE